MSEERVGQPVPELGTVVRSTEVVPKRGRRTFTKAYIDSILKELDEAPHGEAGKILRREGLYSQAVAKWRQHRSPGATVAKRGPKESSGDELRQKVAKQNQQIKRLQRKLDQAEKIIDLQKKVSELLGISLSSEDQN